MLLVTHDVEEAICSPTGRAALAAARAASCQVLDVPLARPRSRTDLAVVELRERALAALGVTG